MCVRFNKLEINCIRMMMMMNIVAVRCKTVRTYRALERNNLQKHYLILTNISGKSEKDKTVLSILK